MKNKAVTPAAKIKNILKRKPSQSKRSIPPKTRLGSAGRAKNRISAKVTSSPTAVNIPRNRRRFASFFRNGSRISTSTASARSRISGRMGRMVATYAPPSRVSTCWTPVWTHGTIKAGNRPMPTMSAIRSTSAILSRCIDRSDVSFKLFRHLAEEDPPDDQ